MTSTELFYPPEQDIFALIGAIYGTTHSLSHPAKSGWYLTVQPTPALTGANGLGLSAVGKRLSIVMLAASYADTVNDETVNKAAANLISSIESATKTRACIARLST
ncbi:hypothetical protein EYZ11_011670 [Aspergillus tanneri]|uniref:Uncharacterized protein n=1 Tax=Aspergillus tanneri TaxID=1220188 RepID=A0A4S3J291_9EURO|nr:hypothetical protein EYZ11_011670 [Aspergillus tanneri]